MIDSLLIEVFCKSCEPEVVLPFNQNKNNFVFTYLCKTHKSTRKDYQIVI